MKFRLKNGCKITTGEGKSRVEYPNWAPIEGEPMAGQETTAEELGYGDNIAWMVEEHDPVHAILTSALWGRSQSLGSAIGRPYEKDLAMREETAVLALQALMHHLKMNPRELAARLGVLDLGASHDDVE